MNPKKKHIRVGTATRSSRYPTRSVAFQADLLDTHWKKKKNIRKFRKLYCQLKPKKKAPPQKNKETKPSERKILNFNILQANVCGIDRKKEHLKTIMDKSQVHIALFQETMHFSCATNIPGYTEYTCECKDKGRKCQGIITYIRNDVQGEVTHLDCHPTDTLKATVWIGDHKLKIYNTYCPPGESLNFPETDTTFTKTIIAGDFNGHNPLWGYADYDDTGRTIEELCQSTNLCLLQDENSPKTLLHRRHGKLYRPDLSLVSADLENHCSEVLLEDIASDHRPILTQINIVKQKSRKRKTRWNFKKGNWDPYLQQTEEKFDLNLIIDMDHETLNKYITTTILDASKLHIPRGCRQNYKPHWNDKLDQAVQVRHAARLKCEDDAKKNVINLENKTDYNKATAQTKLATKAFKKETWTKTCEGLNLKQGGREAWKLLENLSGETRKRNPQPLHLETETITSEFKKTELFNKAFASVSKASKKTNVDRDVSKLLKEEEGKGTDNRLFLDQLTPSELDKAFRKLKKRKSPGPDKIHNEMLLHLGSKGKEALLLLFNKTWEHGQVPKAWKLATIAPILKNGKRADKPQSYRPISLTSCIGKLCERMINNRLYWYLESTGKISQAQAGFRTKSRTEDQLFRLTQRILDGFQKEQHTTAVFIDLQQAYDRVWRKGLYLKMQNMGIKGKLYRWIKSFLTDRLIETNINDSLSSKEVLEEGLPQGSSLSCTLFLIFINDLTKSLTQTEMAMFADDLVIWHTSNSTIISQRRVQEDLGNLENYCIKWKLKINSTKTVYSIFSQSDKVAARDLTLKINNITLEKDVNPVYLGVQLDTKLSMNKHISNVKKKATKRLNLLKRLASTTWGSDKDTLRSLYLGYIRSAMDYNIVLQNISSKSTRKTLDQVQNHALRFICGGMKSTPSAACEIDANIEPLEMRRKKAALEIYERSKRLETTHPNRKLVDKWKPCNRIKQQSILHKVESLKEEHHLPEVRENLERVPSKLPPFLPLRQATIKTNLNDNSTKKSDPLALKLSSLETIDAYPKDWIHSYTDGSAFKATINAGYGAVIYFPNGTKEEILHPCGSVCSNYIAEQLAIHSAITHIHHTFDTNPSCITNTVIFTDSLSALQALESGTDVSTEMTQLTWNIHSLISKFNIGLVLQWIPGHAGVPGNETADKLAKRGAALPQPIKPATYETTCQMIKSNLREEWMNSWTTGTTGRPMHAHMNKPKHKDPIKKLKREEQTIIFRLRTRHIPLNNHLKRINVSNTAACPLCGYGDETVEHHLFDCVALKELRKRFLPPNANIHRCLYDTSEQMRKTCSYFRIASGKRAKAQPPLVR